MQVSCAFPESFLLKTFVAYISIIDLPVSEKQEYSILSTFMVVRHCDDLDVRGPNVDSLHCHS